MWESIRELIGILDKDGRRSSKNVHIEHLSNRRRELYEAICQHPNASQDEMARLLSFKPKPSYLIKLRERLYNDLVNAIVIRSGHHSHDTYAVVRKRCLRQVAALRIMFFEGMTTNVRQMGRRIVNLCKRYEFFDLLTDVLLLMMELYGRVLQDKKMFHQYLDMYREAEKIVRIEREAMVKYAKIYATYTKASRVKKKTDITDLHRDKDWFEDQLSKKLSVKCSIYSTNALCAISEILGDYQVVIDKVDQLLTSIKDKPQDSDLVRTNFLYKKFRAHLKLKNHDAVMDTLKDLDQFHAKYSMKYYITTLHKIIMYMHNGKYHSAAELILDIRDRHFRSKAPDYVQEYIEVIYGYLTFLYKAGVYESSLISRKRFRIYKFLNQVPAYSRDKSGVNIAILILHMLLLIQQKKYDEVVERREALNQYAYRYLRHDDTFRSQCFMKMLFAVIKADFKPASARQLAQPWLAKLRDESQALSGQPLEVEIVSYEQLWDVLCQELE